MKVTRYSILGFLLVFTLMLTACGDLSEKLFGAWKSETADQSTGKPFIVLLSKDSLSLNGKTTKILYKSVALNVDVIDATTQQSVFLAANIEKNSVVFQGGPFQGMGKVKFLRISEDEAKKLAE